MQGSCRLNGQSLEFDDVRLTGETFAAEAGTYEPVGRGKTVRLDGSRSSGRIVSYSWSYRLGRGCPADPTFAAAVRGPDSGHVVNVRLLCTTIVTLRVTEPEGRPRSTRRRSRSSRGAGSGG